MQINQFDGSREITQFDCPILSEIQLDDFTALVLVSPLNAPEDSGRTSCAIRTSLSARCGAVYFHLA